MITLHEKSCCNNEIGIIIKNLLKDIRILLELNACLLFMFDDAENYAKLMYFDVDEGIELNSYNKIDLTNNYGSLLKLLFLEQKTIVFQKGSCYYNNIQYTPLIENSLGEIYYPLFSPDNQLIACLYLSTINEPIDYEICNSKIQKSLEYINNISLGVYEKYRHKRIFNNIIHTFCEIFKNDFMYINHMFNVAFWSSCIAQELKLNNEETKKLYMASIMHDVGKLLIEKDFVNKKGRLTDEEYNSIKKHSIYGYYIIKDFTNGLYEYADLDIIVRHHHERYDGKGYPDQIKGEAIPLLSRILAVSDSFDAMISERSYKTCKSIELAIQELIKNKGKQFDPVIVDIMVKILIDQQSKINALIGDITWSILQIETKSNIYNVQGNLIKKFLSFEFKSQDINILNNIEYDKIENCSILIDQNDKLIEYNIKIGSFKDNLIYITEIIPKPPGRTFGLYWNLPGTINNKMKIYINKLNVDMITFYISYTNQEKLILGKKYLLKILFEDSEKLECEGKIIRTYQYGYKIFCDFKFINIEQNLKEMIYKQVFLKQIQPIRHLLNKYI